MQPPSPTPTLSTTPLSGNPFVPPNLITPQTTAAIPDGLWKTVTSARLTPSQRAQIIPRISNIERQRQFERQLLTPFQAFQPIQTPKVRTSTQLEPKARPRLTQISPLEQIPITPVRRTPRGIPPIAPPPMFALPPFAQPKKKKKKKPSKQKLKRIVWQAPDTPFGYYNPTEYAVQGTKLFKQYSKISPVDL